jgi:hypothetical protein
MMNWKEIGITFVVVILALAVYHYGHVYFAKKDVVTA